MNPSSAIQVIQIVGWSLALIELILALYVLLLNPRHTANQHAGVLLLTLAVNSFALSQLAVAGEVLDATVPTFFLAATSASFQPLVLVVSIALIKPEWLPRRGGRGRWRWLLLIAYFMALLPALLTVVDLLFGTGFWFTGPDPASYTGGYVKLAEYAGGAWSLPIRVMNFYIISLLIFAPLLYVALRDQSARPAIRRLAWLLLGTQVVITVLQFGLTNVAGVALATLVTNAILVLVYAYSAFRQMISERIAQRGRLQPRLVALTLAIAGPLLVAVVLFLNSAAGAVIQQDALDNLKTANQATSSSISMWLDLNFRALAQMVGLPPVKSMDPAQQRPVMKSMAEAFPYMYLVSTTDREGMNVARNDDVDLTDYSDRTWYQLANQGQPLVLQTLLGRTSKQPALVASMPILDPAGEIVGVGMFASTLTSIGDQVALVRLGETGFAYVVDDQDQLIAHPNAALFDRDDLPSFADQAAVQELRAGTRGFVRFEEDGQRWAAYVDELDNGWGVVVQQQESELLASLATVRGTAWLLIGGGLLLLALLFWLTLRQALNPVASLTETVAAISAGDLQRQAEVEAEDEIGALARAFNAMTGRLRELIGSLEQRVEERTQDLERRTRYLEASSQVARDTTTILDLQELLNRVVNLVSERFGFYHTGIFLLDESRRWAVLQAASSEGGRRMLARGHRLAVGEMGIVGYVTSQGVPRIALDVGEDAVFFDNPDLPETRSEMALPLRVRGEIIGALDVQSVESRAFSQEDVETLQTLADQVAIAISNARLFQQTEEALEAQRRAYGQISSQGWADLVGSRGAWGYRADAAGVHPAFDGQEMAADQPQEALAELSVPLRLGDQHLGFIQAHKAEQSWSEEEKELFQSLAGQLEIALESARLYRETQLRVAQEQIAGDVTARMRESLEIDTILQTAIREMHQVLNLAESEIRLGDPQ